MSLIAYAVGFALGLCFAALLFLLRERRLCALHADERAELRASIAGSCHLMKEWRNRAIAHGYTDEYVERERDAATSGKARP